MKILIFLAFVSLSVATVSGQDQKVRKIEVGGHISELTISDPTALEVVNGTLIGDSKQTRHEIGVGGRFTYNLSKFIAFDSEVNFFPRNYNALRTEFTGGRVIQALAGLKAGYRSRTFGIYSKFRPGVMSSGGSTKALFPDGTGPDPRDPFGFEVRRVNLLTLDVGGVFEYYPSKRTIVRFDAGDTITRYPDIPFFQFRPTGGVPIIETIFTHRPQFTVGFSYRF